VGSEFVIYFFYAIFCAFFCSDASSQKRWDRAFRSEIEKGGHSEIASPVPNEKIFGFNYESERKSITQPNYKLRDAERRTGFWFPHMLVASSDFLPFASDFVLYITKGP
jgi:hypothetical protein